jgi:hypothetical protein
MCWSRLDFGSSPVLLHGRDSGRCIRGEEIAKNQGVSQGVERWAKLGSNLGPDSAENPLKPHYRTQNQSKRWNKLDNRNCFGTSDQHPLLLRHGCYRSLSGRRHVPPSMDHRPSGAGTETRGRGTTDSDELGVTLYSSLQSAKGR